MIQQPQCNLARRLWTKHELSPPVNVIELARCYARVERVPLPAHFDIDGATFDLKVRGKTPTIVINAKRAPRRARFTLAHELGHVLIPWHVGSIVDEVILSSAGENAPYSVLEAEANGFASELLMPSSWLCAIARKFPAPPDWLKYAAEVADVSHLAAAIALIDVMPPGYVYAVVKSDGDVCYSGRTLGTLVNPPVVGSQINRGAFDRLSDQRWRLRRADELYLWWHIPPEVDLPDPDDDRTWREILSDMIQEVKVPESSAKKFKQSVNGVFGFANGISAARAPEGVYAAALQRFHSRADNDELLRRFVEHQKFTSFLRKRVEDVLKKSVQL